jgi:hypothetical protein
MEMQTGPECSQLGYVEPHFFVNHLQIAITRKQSKAFQETETKTQITGSKEKLVPGIGV